MVLKDTVLNHRCGVIFLLISVSAILLLVLCAGSAVASDYSVAYGETVKLSVNNPFGGTAYLYIQGPNIKFSPLKDASGDQLTVTGRGARTVELQTSGLHLDVGTYTIYVSNNPKATSTKNLDSGNGFWDSFTLTLRPITFTADIVSTSPQVSTPVPTPQSTQVPIIASTPMPTSTPVPASPAPVVAIIAGLATVVLARQRFN